MTAPTYIAGGTVALAALLAVPHWLVAAVLIGGFIGWLGYGLTAHRARRAAAATVVESVRAALAEARVASVWDAHVPLLELDTLASGRITRVSGVLAEAAGYAPAAMLGTVYLDYLTPACHAATVQAVARAARDGVVPVLGGFRNEWTAGPLHARPGSAVHMEWSPVGSDGALWVGYDRTADVLAKRHAETRAADAEADLDAIRPSVDAALRTAGPAGPLRAVAGPTSSR